MNFSISETQQMITDSIKDFCKARVVSNIMKWDEEQNLPIEIYKELGRLGMMGVLVEEKYGGSGFGYKEYITVVSEIAKFDPSIGLSVAAHNSLCTGHIHQFGSEEQKNKYLPKLATAQWLGAWGLTEVNTGSDAGGMDSTAIKDGNEWIINGSKNFITLGGISDVAVVIIRTGKKGDSHGMTSFIIEKGTKGFSVGRKEDKLGMRASETTELIFDNCRVANENVIGKVGEGFVQSMKVLDGGRISIASLALGISKGAYQASLKYSKERCQFNKPISNFQAIAFKLADMATEIEASELLIFQAAELKNKGAKCTKESAMAKLFASEVCVGIANEAVQIFGGYGYTKDFPVEKFYRDSKLCTIGEGTTEIQKLVVSREILK